MRVSLTWLGVFLLFFVILMIGWKGKAVYETFTTLEKEGFVGYVDDLQISTCPANSVQFIDRNGMVLCCDGSLENGVCNGKTICSLSESSSNYPTCSRWFAAYLNEKGRTRCPPSMPNYYESRDGTVKGCTSGKRNKDGSGPATSTNKFCRLYTTQKEEEGKIDSCTNQKLLESTQCFKKASIQVEKTLIPVLNGEFPAQVQCNFGDIRSRTAGTCITNDSMERFIDRVFTAFGIRPGDWKANSVNWDPIEKMNFCSVAEKYKIQKILTYKDLPTVRVFD